MIQYLQYSISSYFFNLQGILHLYNTNDHKPKLTFILPVFWSAKDNGFCHTWSDFRGLGFFEIFIFLHNELALINTTFDTFKKMYFYNLSLSSPLENHSDYILLLTLFEIVRS